MTGGKARPLPTDAELALLHILWKRGPSSVREVHDALARDVGYTSVLKQLQIMHEKGLVSRRDDARAHVYTAAEPRAAVEKRVVGDLARRLFGGSHAQLAMRALSLRPPSKEELARIRRLLEEERPE